MSEQEPQQSGQSQEQHDPEPNEVTDEMLPEDLQPSEDNPLARHPGQTGDDEDLIGAAGDEERARNPSASMTYGSAGDSGSGGSGSGSDLDDGDRQPHRSDED